MKKMTNPVFLGPNLLKWCDYCNIPIVSSNKCSTCNNETREVKITPPFDVRPVFKYGLELLKRLIESAYGLNASKFLESKIILFNRAPDIDTLEEVILDGRVIGKLRFNPHLIKWQFIPTIDGALRMHAILNKYPKWVSIDKGAVPFIRRGANILSPGIIDFDKSIEKNDFVFIINPKKELIGIGKSRYSNAEIKEMKKGEVIKSYEYIKNEKDAKILKSGQTWADVIDANNEMIQRKVKQSRKILRKAIQIYPNTPIVVSFSGGKDSLCSLLITKEEINDFKIIFLNTGVEFPETVEYTKKIIKKLNLDSKLIIANAENIFWEVLPLFGMPTRDYRWCNKLLKLNLIKKVIDEQFENKILTVVGTRKRESRSRYKEKTISENRNVKGQINVNIIHNWTTLQVWIYILKMNIEFNPIYKFNFNRVGCWLCPSSKLSELETIKSTHPKLYNKLYSALKKYQKNIGAPDEYLKYGFWRWRNISKGMNKLADELKIRIDLDYSSYEEFNW